MTSTPMNPQVTDAEAQTSSRGNKPVDVKDTVDATEAGLTITDVSVHYGPTVAVNHVSMSIPLGQIVALLGASGSGKSSLLRALVGLEPVASGDVQWNGHSVVDVPVHQRGFGLMFQDGQLFPHLNVAGNVAYGLKHLPRSERDAIVSASLELVGMSAFASRAVNSLSGGQMQRVALARALAPQPALLLLDEPLSALDRALRERLSHDIRRILRASDTSGIYVTHDQEEAFTVADVVGIMVDGRLLRLASPDEVWADPKFVEVAEFLGMGPVITGPVNGEKVVLTVNAVRDVRGTDSDGVDSAGKLVSTTLSNIRTGRGELIVDLQVDGSQVLRLPVPLGSPMADRVRELYAGDTVALFVDWDHCPTVTPFEHVGGAQ